MHPKGVVRFRRGLDVIIAASALGIALLGLSLLVQPRSADAYSAAPPCAKPANALSRTCYTKVLVSVQSVTIVRHGKAGPVSPEVSVVWALVSSQPFVLSIPQPPVAFYAIHSGDLVVLKVWNGIPTALYTLDNSAMRTSFNPYSRDDTMVWGGFSLLGVGLILLVVHPLPWLLPVRLRPSEMRPRRWRQTADNTAGLFRDGRLRVAVVGLIVLNLMDIASSIIGGKNGLFEGNPVAARMIEAWGPLGGFFALKLPALLAIILAVTKLPRRIALAVAYAACMVMIVVVVGNVVLVYTNSAA